MCQWVCRYGKRMWLLFRKTIIHKMRVKNFIDKNSKQNCFKIEFFST